MNEPRKRERTRGTGSLFQKVNGKGQKSKFWHIQYFKNDPATGKRIRIREATGLTSRPEAEKFLRTRLGQIDRGELFDVKRVEAVRVEDLFKLLIDHKKDNAPNEKAVTNLEGKLRMHLRPAFGSMVAANVTTDHVNAYKRKREKEGAAKATINHELAELRHAFNLGKQATPPKVRHVPYIQLFKENNVRTGFVEDQDFRKLEALAIEHALLTGEHWLRLFLELSYSYGWRADSELIALRVRHINLRDGKIRLDPGMAKNKEGREVHMTSKVRELLAIATHDKRPNDFVFTRADGKPVKDFRRAWENLCVGAGLGKHLCAKCGAPWGEKKCSQCSNHLTKRRKYEGLLRHDMRRSAAKRLRRAGIPESTIMVVGGWKSASVFRRYAIVSDAEQRDVAERLEQAGQDATVPPQPRQDEISERGESTPVSLKVQ